MTARDRAARSDARASIRLLSERSMVLSGQKPCDHSRSSDIRSDGIDCLKRQALVELRWIEDRLDVLRVDVVGPIALERVRDEVRRELDHPRARVLVSLLVERDGEPLDRLEQRREEEADTGPAPTTCTRPRACGALGGCRTWPCGHSPVHSMRSIGESGQQPVLPPGCPPHITNPATARMPSPTETQEGVASPTSTRRSGSPALLDAGTALTRTDTASSVAAPPSKTPASLGDMSKKER